MPTRYMARDGFSRGAAVGGCVRVIALMGADFLCVFLLWLTVAGFYKLIGFGKYDLLDYFQFWPIAVGFLVFNAIAKLYHGNCFYPSAPIGEVEEFRRLVGGALITHLAAMAFLGFSRNVDIVSRLVLAVSGVGVAVFAQSFRNIVRKLLLLSGAGQMPVFLIGSGPLAQQVADSLAQNPFFGYRVVGSFDHRGDAVRGVPRLGSLRDVVSFGRDMHVVRLVVCEDERLMREQLLDFLAHFQFVDYFPSSRAFPVFQSRLVDVDGVGGVEMVNQSCMKLLGVEKKVIDFLIAVLSMLVFWPLFIIIPVLIKVTSKGPAFYRHRRLGQNGRPIGVWKFRSMYADADERLKDMLSHNPTLKAEWETNFKLKHDPRITPIGAILRKTSLDELPQLLNVFSGDMAVVGPRPIVEDEVAYYGDKYAVFSRVKPGITGLWQASGRSDTDYARRVALDCHYVLNWSPWMDIWIVLRTAFAVITMKGSR